MITRLYLCFRQQEFNEAYGNLNILTKKYGEGIIISFL